MAARKQKDKLPVRLLDLKPAGGQLNMKVFGSPPRNNPSNKTIMVVGATGSGKTTLINGMINYILGVQWEDNWRYKLIDEQFSTTQAESQTSEVTAYQIYHKNEFKVPFSLTIIDTPGFGDTKGIAQDKKITENIRKFFSIERGIDRIDAVCFVVPSASLRLTPTQKYIFEAILSIFGKDIGTNIIVLVTFADGQPPQVLEALKAANIPCAKAGGAPLHFKFNNSALFADNNEGSNDGYMFDSMYWQMGKTNMKKFFTHLNLMKPQSLTLTKAVLEERIHLEATVEGVQPIIHAGLSKLEEINTRRATLQTNETHIRENGNYNYEVQKLQIEKIKLTPGEYVTNCIVCNSTCHYPCVFANNAEKQRCSAMKNGNCTVCPEKCIWSLHANMDFRVETKYVTEKETYQELKSKYEAALGEKMSSVKIIKQLETEYEQVQGKVVAMMDELTASLQRLKEIALRPDPVSTAAYIDLLIEAEKQEAKPGWQTRAKELKEVREKSLLLTKWAEGVDLTGTERAQLMKIRSNVKGIFNNPTKWLKP